jgi:predicted permease
MQAVTNAVNIVLSIFIIIGAGIYLTWRNRLNDENAALISHLVVKVALPCSIINNLFVSFNSASMLECILGLVAPVLSIFLMLVLGMGLARLLKLPKKRRGVFACMVCSSNTVFIGVPVSTALFGDAVMPYTLLYYFANTVIFWTLGILLLQKDSGTKFGGDFKALPAYLLAKTRAFFHRTFLKKEQDAPQNAAAQTALDMLRKMVPLPIVVFVLCVVLVLMNVTLPEFVIKATGYIGGMVTPLSLFFIGIVVMRMIRQKNFRWEKGYLTLIITRFAVSTVLMFFCAKMAGLPELMTKVLIVQAGMPIMSQTPIVAGSMGSDEEYAAGAVALTTLLSLAAVPIYMMVL